ncbi:MAG: DUF2877 domain-containing protein [Rhodospirillales bacterium]|jgi:hypothetical protein|nr:DUF2877 domain-containing protein [Rhodospirillales bacterium]
MTPDRTIFPVTRVGAAAQALLQAEMIGRVLAVFRRTFYVIDSAGGVVCIGDASLGAGPLNATCGILHNDWRAGPLSPGDPARMTGGVLSIGHRSAFSLVEAETWKPAFRPTYRGWAALRRGLRHLAERAAMEAPADGLGRMISPLAAGDRRLLERGEGTPVAKAAAPGIGALWHWLSRRLIDPAYRAAAPSAVASLLGMGPGLTPSGDDFLGGVAVTLRALGCRESADDLAACLIGPLPDRTGTISAAHLRQALVGDASAVTLEAVDAVLAGDPVRIATAGRVAATIGHTSGWDTLCGVACAAASFAAAPQEAEKSAVLYA